MRQRKLGDSDKERTDLSGSETRPGGWIQVRGTHVTPPYDIVALPPHTFMYTGKTHLLFIAPASKQCGIITLVKPS